MSDRNQITETPQELREQLRYNNGFISQQTQVTPNRFVLLKIDTEFQPKIIKLLTITDFIRFMRKLTMKTAFNIINLEVMIVDLWDTNQYRKNIKMESLDVFTLHNISNLKHKGK